MPPVWPLATQPMMKESARRISCSAKLSSAGNQLERGLDGCSNRHSCPPNGPDESRFNPESADCEEPCTLAFKELIIQELTTTTDPALVASFMQLSLTSSHIAHDALTRFNPSVTLPCPCYPSHCPEDVCSVDVEAGRIPSGTLQFHPSPVDTFDQPDTDVLLYVTANPFDTEALNGDMQIEDKHLTERQMTSWISNGCATSPSLLSADILLGLDHLLTSADVELVESWLALEEADLPWQDRGWEH